MNCDVIYKPGGVAESDPCPDRRGSSLELLRESPIALECQRVWQCKPFVSYPFCSSRSALVKRPRSLVTVGCADWGQKPVVFHSAARLSPSLRLGSSPMRRH